MNNSDNSNMIRIPVPADYNNMMFCLSELCERYDGASFTYLGTSVEGRAIPLVALGDESSRSAVLYVGTQCAAEAHSASLLLEFIKEWLIASSASDERADLLKRKLICVVPMLNPDGVELQLHGASPSSPIHQRQIRMNGGGDFSRWQANARGVTLDHNYSSGFYEYKEVMRKQGICAPSPSGFAGEYPESEPEVGALCNYIRFSDNIKGVLILSEEEGSSEGSLSRWVTSDLKKQTLTLHCKKINALYEDTANEEIYRSIRKALFEFPAYF